MSDFYDHYIPRQAINLAIETNNPEQLLIEIEKCRMMRSKMLEDVLNHMAGPSVPIMVIKTHQTECLKILLNCEAKHTFTWMRALLRNSAVYQCNMTHVELALKHGACRMISQGDGEGFGLLLMLIEKCKSNPAAYPILEYLLPNDNCALYLIDYQSKSTYSLLISAIYHQVPQCVEALIKRGADVNKAVHGRDPLEHAKQLVCENGTNESHRIVEMIESAKRRKEFQVIKPSILERGVVRDVLGLIENYL